jgi:uncharacterized membrane protein
MFELAITPELLSYVLATVVAVVLDWFPKVREWFDLFSDSQKKFIMALVLGAVVASIYALGCFEILANMTCDRAQVTRLVEIYLVSVGVNQGVHALTKPKNSTAMDWVG